MEGLSGFFSYHRCFSKFRVPVVELADLIKSGVLNSTPIGQIRTPIGDSSSESRSPSTVFVVKNETDDLQ
jgi:hypothetical protein